MTRDLLLEMLEANELSLPEGGRLETPEGVELALLLLARPGVTPLPRLGALTLGEAFVIAETEEEERYTLRYEVVAGLKVRRRGGTSTRRAGFV